jgi:AcrR family transcriptional regulator
LRRGAESRRHVDLSLPSIDSLLGAALREASIEYTNSAIESARALPGARDRLMSLIDAALPSSARSLRNWRLWIEYWARASHLPDLAALHSERYAEWRSTFAEIVAQGVGSGEFRAVDPSSTALTLVALLDGLGLQTVIGDSPSASRPLAPSWTSTSHPSDPERPAIVTGTRSGDEDAVTS